MFSSIAKRLNSEITSVDICPVLKQHTEENIYCRTDHHWQPLGAYYAAKTFAEAAGVSFDDINKYNKVTDEGYVGTLYAFYGDERIKMTLKALLITNQKQNTLHTIMTKALIINMKAHFYMM